MKLRYFKSKHFNTYFYECCQCGLDLKPGNLEAVANTNCKCGMKITAEDVIAAKNDYIAKVERMFQDETNLDLLTEIIVLNILNKTRQYYGKDTIPNNDFLKELKNDTKEKIVMFQKEQ